MAKKAAAVFASWGISWGETDNVVSGIPNENPVFKIYDDLENEFVQVEQDGTDVIVTVGPVIIRVRKPTLKEKKKSKYAFMVSVEEGLDNDCVVLTEECGAQVPVSDEDE